MPDQAEHHPKPDQLRAFDQGRLRPAEWGAVERHILDCAACADQLQKLPEQRLVDLLGEYDPSRTCGDTPDGISTPWAPPAVAEEIPRELAEHPRYRLQELLGAGGMGMVFCPGRKRRARPIAHGVTSLHP